MSSPRRIYEHRDNCNNTLFIGIFRRCETRLTYLTSNNLTLQVVCDENKYCFPGNSKCPAPSSVPSSCIDLVDDTQKYCNLNGNPFDCAYSSITKGLISCPIIAACFLGIALLLVFAHILINSFHYQTHLRLTIFTLILLILGFLFLLTTLILLGATMASDLYQYRYNLDYRLQNENGKLSIDVHLHLIYLFD